MSEFTVGDVVAKYIELRNKKEAIEADTKEQVSALRVKMEQLEGWIKEQADSLGVTSFKTPSGTAFVTTTDFANVGDWDSVLKFIKEESAYHMLERRISKNAVRDYIKETNQVPPGVNYGTKIGVNVRKPSASAE